MICPLTELPLTGSTIDMSDPCLARGYASPSWLKSHRTYLVSMQAASFFAGLQVAARLKAPAALHTVLQPWIYLLDGLQV